MQGKQFEVGTPYVFAIDAPKANNRTRIGQGKSNVLLFYRW